MKIGARVKISKTGQLGRVVGIDRASQQVTIKSVAGAVFTEEIQKLIILTILEWIYEKIKQLVS